MLVAAAIVTLASAMTGAQGGPGSVPRITLEEALSRARALDPNYVAAVRRVAESRWDHTAAVTSFIVPEINAQLSGTRFSNQFFNIGTGMPASQIVDARVEARLNLFRGFGKISDLKWSNAQLESARAGEHQARFVTALFTEADYFDVLAQGELTRVAEERVRRADDQLAVARARVVAGAAVQTDSLQLLLELTEAQVELLRQEARLRVSRFQLGRRVGADGPVDGILPDTLLEPDLPLTEDEAVQEAIASSPAAVQARADERAAESLLSSAKGAYLPSIDLFGQITSTDDRFFPDAVNRSAIGLSVSLPIWNDAQREIRVSQATTVVEVTRSNRQDVERGLRRDVVEAYQGYETARAAGALAEQAVIVATENLRVQQERYRTGASVILDLLTAQVGLAEAEAGLVQARYTTRLALSALEAILGRRLF